MDGTPQYGDSDNTLLSKIVLTLSIRFGDPTLAPALGDSKNTLLFKWAKLLANNP